MSSATTLYTHNEFIRPIVAECLLKYFKSDVKIVEITEDVNRYLERFPVRTVPGLSFNDGTVLFEQIAVTKYIIRSYGNEKETKQLLGLDSDFKHQGDIDMFCSFCTSDFLNQLVDYCLHDLKGIPISEGAATAAGEKLEVMYPIFEQRLQKHKYLTGDVITLADLIAASSFSLGFCSMLGAEWSRKHTLITDWFKNVTQSEYMLTRFQNFKYSTEPHRITEHLLPWDEN